MVYYYLVCDGIIQTVYLQDKDGKTDGAENDSEKKVKEDGEDEGEDKLWADVDKDLGDILAEAESGNKSSDEDDNGERYDR